MYNWGVYLIFGLRLTYKNTFQKITKSNVWNISLIDNFSALIKGHHRELKDFSIAGSTLEASSKIYGLRVDSVHSDVLNIANGLSTFQQGFAY